MGAKTEKTEREVIIIILPRVDDGKAAPQADRQADSLAAPPVSQPVGRSVSQLVRHPGRMGRRLRRMEEVCASVSTLARSLSAVTMLRHAAAAAVYFTPAACSCSWMVLALCACRVRICEEIMAGGEVGCACLTK